MTRLEVRSTNAHRGSDVQVRDVGRGYFPVVITGLDCVRVGEDAAGEALDNEKGASNLARLGWLPRTRPILPGEVIVSD